MNAPPSYPPGYPPGMYFQAESYSRADTDDLQEFCDLYNLSDIANESFNLLGFSSETPSGSPNNPAKNANCSRISPAPPLISPGIRQISPLLCTRNVESPVYHHTALPSLRENFPWYADPNFLPVYTQSGLPVCSQQSSCERENHFPPEELCYAEGNDAWPVRRPPEYSECVLSCSAPQTDAVPRTPVAAEGTDKKRGRGRPRKVRSQSDIPAVRKAQFKAAKSEIKIQKTVMLPSLTEKENFIVKPPVDSDEAASVGESDMFGEEDDLEEAENAKLNDDLDGSIFPKPPFSYSALVTVALKNSRCGRMTVRDIYNFMCQHFPYFRTASSGWKLEILPCFRWNAGLHPGCQQRRFENQKNGQKILRILFTRSYIPLWIIQNLNSVRHNLSLNPGFLKIVTESGLARSRVACRWTINPERFNKLNDDMLKWISKSLELTKKSMRNPELLPRLMEGTFTDFAQAIKGVTVQKKNLGMGRRKTSKTNVEQDWNFDCPGSPFSDCVTDFLKSGEPVVPPVSAACPSEVEVKKERSPTATEKRWNGARPQAPGVKMEIETDGFRTAAVRLA